MLSSALLHFHFMTLRSLRYAGNVHLFEHSGCGLAVDSPVSNGKSQHLPHEGGSRHSQPFR